MKRKLISLALGLIAIVASASVTPAQSGFGGIGTSLQSQLAPSACVASEENVVAKVPKSDGARGVTFMRDKLVGDYLDERYYPATTLAGLYKISISLGEGDNALVIKNLLGGGKSVDATVDMSTGTISIAPGQVVGELEDGTQLKAYYVDLTQKVYYTNVPIKGVISESGIITMGSWLVVGVGPTQGQIITDHDLDYRFNATATHTSILDGKEYSHPVHVSKMTTSQYQIKNIWNTGFGTDASIDSLGNMVITRKVIGYGQNASGATVNLYNNKVTAYNDEVTPPTYTMSTAAVAAKWEGTTITIDPWAIASGTTASSVIGDVIKKTVISGLDEYVPFTAAFTLKGSGTQADPYIVATPEDLVNLSTVSNYNAAFVASNYTMRGKYVSQTADIDMSGVENFEPIAMLSNRYFAAHYNGNGHKISNLKVNQTKGSAYYSGLFGNVREGSVTNLVIENPVIVTTSGYTGGVVGYLSGTVKDVKITGLNLQGPSSLYYGGVAGYLLAPGRVENTTVSGTMTANDYVGGVAGNAPGGKVINCVADVNIVRAASTTATPRFGGIVGTGVRDTLQIRDCAFYGSISISGNEIAGGIIGSIEKGEVSGCHFGGMIMHSYGSTSTAQIGGVAGTVKDGRIYDCLSSGIIQSYVTPTVGGLAGTITQSVTSPATEVKRTLYTGTMMVNNSVRGNEFAATETGTVGKEHNWFDVQTSGNYGEGVKTRELTGATLPSGLSSNLWTANEGLYPMLKAFANCDKAKLDRVPFFLADADNVKSVKSNFTLGSGDGVTWCLFHNGRYSQTGNGLSISGSNVAHTATTTVGDTLVALKGDNLFRMYPLVIVAKEFAGSGTKEEPFLIASKADLDRMCSTVDKLLCDYSDTYFKITNDIDMTGTPASFRGYSVNGVAYAFNGHLNGDGHSIKNLVIGMPEKANDPGSLFNYLGSEAEVKNLVIDGSCSFAAGSYAGSVAGYNAGTIIDCINHASVKAYYRYAGGIAGASTNTVDGCFNDGNIIGDQYYVGGIVGANTGYVRVCQNSGRVSSELIGGFGGKDTDCSYVGGIAGLNNGSVTSSLNQGMINGASLVGGIVGDHSAAVTFAFTGNINTGVVMSAHSPLTIGAIAGRKTTANTASVTGNIFDKQLSHNAAVNNTSLDGNDGLLTSAMVSGVAPEGYPTVIWSWEKDRYPVLAKFASEPAAIFYSKARVEFAEQPKVESRFDKRTDAKAVAPDGSSITLKVGKSFTLSGTVLSHVGGTEAAVDTLTISQGSYLVEVPLFASPKLLANGDGSAGNPWLITSANDWNTIALYAQEYRSTFEGDHFRLANDIDFSRDGFLPICQDGSTYFEGNFDGNGKTLSGIKYVNEDSKLGLKVGLFGMTGANAEIYNFTLSDNDTIIGYQYVGGVAGYGGGKIYGITNKATVSTMKMTAAGGIVGYGLPSADVHDCVNYGAITAFTTAGGGIMGTNEPGAKVYDCKNYGYVTSAGSTGGILGSTKAGVSGCSNFGEIYSSVANAGGIVGYMWPTYTTDNTIRDCENFGKVTTKTSVAGGIAGVFNTPSNIVKCVNYAPVNATTFYAGGIAGSYNSKLVVIDSCVNYGAITTGSWGAGGIVGATMTQSSIKNSMITNVVNYGNIKAGSYNAGGIAGIAKYYTIIKNAYNYCDSVIAGTQYAAGIVGSGGASLTNVFNRAYIQGTYSLGGIIGSNEASGAYNGEDILNAVNVGDVYSTGTTATSGYRIGGILGYGRAYMDNAINFGDITGPNNVGGIAGYPYDASAASPGRINNVYSVGRVMCTLAGQESGCGQVFGRAIPKYYTSIKGCYYDRQMAGSVLYTADADSVTGLTTAELMTADLGAGFVTVAKSYPRLVALADSAAMKLATSVIMLSGNENADKVDSPFTAYCTDGSWIGDKFTFHNHGLVSWNNVSTTEPTVITAKVGNLTRDVKLVFSKSSGADVVNGADSRVVGVHYYTLDGVMVGEPADGIYIRITDYENGCRSTEKVVIKK